MSKEATPSPQQQRKQPKHIEVVLKEIFNNPYSGDDIKTRVAQVQGYIKKQRRKIENQRATIRRLEQRLLELRRG